jgi:outer membrane receptor protein involved in Fe transport
MSSIKRTLLLSAASAVALTGAVSGSAFAQDRGVDVIVVEAQKREQSLQDVPVSVQAVDAELLENSGANDIKELIGLVPGLMVTTTTNQSVTTARIRGVGTVGDNSGLESSVGVVIDGVIRNRNGVGFNDIGEIERIEVLRGPQGTLFGRNTSAGIIQVITRAPEYEYSYGGELTVGNFDEFGTAGFVTGPLAEDAAFRLYAARRTREGFVDNGFNTSQNDYDQDYLTLRGQVLYEPNDNTSFRFIADYTDRNENCCSGVSIISGPVTGVLQALGGPNAYPTTADPDARISNYNDPVGQNIEDFGFSLESEFDLGWGTLTSITAWRDWQTQNGQDIDFSGADILARDESEYFNKFSTLTQEIRLAGSSENFDWMFGLFYADEELTRGDQYRAGAAYESYLSALVSLGAGAPAPDVFFLSDLTTTVGGLAGGVPGLAFGTLYPNDGVLADDLYRQNAETLALFTHNTWSITDQLELTMGLRYTNEEKDLVADFNTNAPGCAFYEGITGALAPGVSDPVGVFLQDPTTAPLAGAVGIACLAWHRSGLDGVGYDQTREENETSGTIRLAYRANDDFMFYGAYSRGYKAGGFNLDRQFNDTNGNGVFDAIDAAAQDTSFEGEFVDSWEAGIRSEWADNTLLANITIFHQEFENFQLNTFLGTTFTVVGIPEVTSQGIEADFLYLPDELPNTTFQGGFAYTDAIYERFTGGFTTGSADLDKISGQNLSLSPEWVWTGAVTHEIPLSDTLGAFLHIDARYVSDYNTGSDLDPEKLQEAFTTLNARVGIGAADESWSLEAWGRNLSDETYYEVAFDAPLQSGSWNAFLGAPRTYGLTLRARR